MDGKGAAGGAAGAGVGHHSHTRQQNARTFDDGSGAGTKGVQEVHAPLGGA